MKSGAEILARDHKTGFGLKVEVCPVERIEIGIQACFEILCGAGPTGKPAFAAMQDGQTVAQFLRLQIRGKPPLRFRRGTLETTRASSRSQN